MLTDFYRIHTITCKNSGWRCRDYKCINVFEEDTTSKLYSNPKGGSGKSIDLANNMICLVSMTSVALVQYKMLL